MRVIRRGFRPSVLLLAFLAVATAAAAQPVPELPPPRPLPQLPPPRPVQPAPLPLPAPPPGAPKLIPGPSPLLAKLAAESNHHAPCCEPPGPTRGLWCGDSPCPHCHSWQQCIMAYRDFLEWCYCRPTCCSGMRPPSDASAVDWMLQWLPFRKPAAPNGTCGSCAVVTHPTAPLGVRD